MLCQRKTWDWLKQVARALFGPDMSLAVPQPVKSLESENDTGQRPRQSSFFEKGVFWPRKMRQGKQRRRWQ